MALRQSNFKIKILPAITTSLSLTFSNRTSIILLVWPIFILSALFQIYKAYFEERPAHTYTYIFKDSPLYYEYYLMLTLDAFLVSVALIIMYRLFVLGERHHRQKIYAKGIDNPKPWLKIPWYFQGGKSLWMFLAFSMIMWGLADLFESIMVWAASFLITADPSEDIYAYYFTLIKLVSLALTGILVAAFAMVWPAIATNSDFKISDIPVLIKSVRENFVRIFLVCEILLLPSIIFDQLAKSIYIISDNDITLYIFDAFGVLIYFLCLSLETAFLSTVYKELIQRGRIKAGS